ncbi:MAG TPA: DUF1028 domain-containing protein [Microbacterium sp.]|uniref:DUF1028 domain-containing protein n=1 Tax=Microbacterium sp. TaxID=51671 RepID=UPI002B9B2858|nr:DUF1028 domain-containing protein [Microbacterium sp.]HWI32291.1 DUF1028 domain-containing protein [Microbacterium sp.]
MTFTILAVSPATGEHGFAQTTSTPLIGNWCTAIVHNKGVVTVQAAGDPRLLRLAVALMEQGNPPAKIIKDLDESDDCLGRQLAVIDVAGRSAVHTGPEAWETAGEIVGPDYVVTGNTLVGTNVLTAMARAFEESAGRDFADRLVASIEAGRDAGGQPDGQTSSQVRVANQTAESLNLRVDLHPEPVGHLRRLLDWYQPLRPYYDAYRLDPRTETFSLDHWEALAESGQPFFPADGGWTAADVEARTQLVLDLSKSDS